MLIDRIFAAKRKNPVADTSKLEREIDAAVYALYLPSLNGKLRRIRGLMPEETCPPIGRWVKIVESAATER